MAAKSPVKLFDLEEIACHNTKKDAYMIVQGKVYDVTKFIDEHPGGEEVMLDSAGQDATEPFDDVGHSEDAWGILQAMQIGELKQSQASLNFKTLALSGWNGKLLGVAVLGIASAAAYGARSFI